MSVPRPVASVSLIALACFWTLPLLSLAHLAGMTWPYPAGLVAIALVTVWRPAVGLVVLSLVVPLAFAMVALSGTPLTAARALEGALLAFLAGWCVQSAIRSPDPGRSRLGWPAVSLAVVVAASAIVTALGQFGSVSEAAGAIGRHLTTTFLAGTGPVQGLAASVRWIEVVTLAAVAERILRTSPSFAPLIVASWAGAGAAAAAQTIVRVTQVALGRNIGWRGAVELFQTTRFGAVYSDINAAGSVFALLLIAAFMFALLRRRWLFGLATVPVLLVALLGTQSRAAVAATLVVAGVAVGAWLGRSGRRRLGIGLVVLVVAVAIPVAVARGATHVSAEAAFSSRVEMWRVALKIAAEDPWFGVGAGRFQAASRDYLNEAFIASFPEAASGENAHNNFLQVLGELGLAGLAGFVWMLWATFRRSTVPPGAERRALVVGLAAFLLSALFGHPLLIYEIAVTFFLAIGLAAGLASPPAAPVRWWTAALAIVMVISLPWRALVALTPDPPAVVGAALATGDLDGQPYRIADPLSRWRLRAHTRAALFSMRWDTAAPPSCRVRIRINGHDVDEIALTSAAWVPVPLIVPPGGRESEPAEVELRVSGPECRLLVGTVTAWR